MRLRPPYVVGLVAVLGTIALGVTDLVVSPLRDFWAEHAMLTNLLSSTLFVIVGLTAVESYIERREERRLRLVIRVAYASVARITRSQLRIMWFLANGGEVIGDLDFDVPEVRRAELRRILGGAGLAEVSENDVRVGAQEIPNVRERVEQLGEDDAWTRLSYDVVRDLLQSSRTVVARWATLLASSDRSSDVLLSLAAQADDLSHLIHRLFPQVRLGQTQWKTSDLQEFTANWLRCYTNAVVMTEGLEAMGGGITEAWGRTEQRKLLPPTQRRFVEGLERNGSLAVLRPYDT